jgi:hypothetical protein
VTVVAIVGDASSAALPPVAGGAGTGRILDLSPRVAAGAGSRTER